MMNPTVVQTWCAGLAMLSPTFLIDRFLDWLEDVCGPIMPAPTDRLACPIAAVELRRDQLDS